MYGFKKKKKAYRTVWLDYSAAMLMVMRFAFRMISELCGDPILALCPASVQCPQISHLNTNVSRVSETRMTAGVSETRSKHIKG